MMKSQERENKKVNMVFISPNTFFVLIRFQNYFLVTEENLKKRLEISSFLHLIFKNLFVILHFTPFFLPNKKKGFSLVFKLKSKK